MPNKFVYFSSIYEQLWRRGDTYIYTDFTLNEDDWFDSWTSNGSSNGLIKPLVPIPDNGVYLGYHTRGVRKNPRLQIDNRAGGLANGLVSKITSAELTIQADLCFTADVLIASYFNLDWSGDANDHYFGVNEERSLHPLLLITVNANRPETGAQRQIAEVTILWSGHFEPADVKTGDVHTDDDPLPMTFVARFGEDPANPGCPRPAPTQFGRTRFIDCVNFSVVNPNNYILYDA